MNRRDSASPKPSLPYSVGQRWISTSEPELGLGTITACADRRIEISFATHAEVRTYAFDSAPLQRIVFSPGNTVETADGHRFSVTAVDEDPQSRLMTYHCGMVSISENILSDAIAFSTPQQRLVAGIIDDITAFSLRSEMVRYRAEINSSAVRGFTGGRIDLIPHQLYIAHRATARSAVRALLADETGLGKTIEACLILHRLLLTGQVTRALILVPDALVHQWFVELLRRFNLTCRLLTEEAFADSDTSSPFDEDPLWICSIATIRRHLFIANQLAGAQWDIVIVDEVHHIVFPDPLFLLLETLAAKSRSMVLLSATPEQFGREGHFTRLRLLDPLRYRETEPPEAERMRLQLIASCIEQRLRDAADEVTPDTPIDLTGELHRFLSERQSAANGQPAAAIPRTLTIGHLIDLFGAGRAYFRNTRRTISGFPKRVVSIVRLDSATAGDVDPHAEWLAKFLKQHPLRKVLAVTSTVEAATAIRDNVQKIIAVDAGLFHESMTLLQRDRQAAWFAEEHGARVLICSDSGSEGRNFQFCSGLVLLDLPWNPELLEQRIGRLDRIGQKHAITIHVPVIPGSPEEILCRWYHEGAGVFEKNVPAAATVFEEMRPRLERLRASGALSKVGSDSLERIIADTQKRTAELTAELFEQRDFLLESASNNPRRARALIDAIERQSSAGLVNGIMRKLFDHFGIKLEEAGSGRFALITEYCTDLAFPLPRSERPVITYDRTTACAHDTVEFLTIDHPMVTGALDLYLSSPHGTSSFALWDDANVTELLLESLYIVECIAPAELRVHRFFNAYPLRIVVNHHKRLVTDTYPASLLDAHLINGPVRRLVRQKKLIEVTFPAMLESSDSFADERIKPAINDARTAMHEAYAAVRNRLSILRSQGAPVSDGEIGHLATGEQELDRRLSAIRVRRDSLRLIRRGAVRGE
ncbi:MAG: DEAD/DEAH box helicase family protein [Chitinispirillaceae bacterium]|nr:DEAD/DEAH box helicase family protein [Chitinispirillaceae bacterium]